MSLATAHRILITAAIVFFLGYAAWEIRRAPAPDAAGPIVRAAVSALAAAGLVLYLRRLLRSLRK
jgi:hypothetical protein